MKLAPIRAVSVIIATLVALSLTGEGKAESVSTQLEFIRASARLEEVERRAAESPEQLRSWPAAIEALVSLARRHPESQRAAAALYGAGSSYRRLYRQSRNPSHLSEAERVLRQLSDSSPKSSLADDALYLLAEIASKDRSDRVAASRIYSELLERYPDGDMAARVRDKGGTLRGQEEVRPERRLAPARKAVRDAEPRPEEAADYRLLGVYPSTFDTFTRITLHLSGPARYQMSLIRPREGTGSGKDELVVDLMKTSISEAHAVIIPIASRYVQSVEPRQLPDGVTRVALRVNPANDHRIYRRVSPDRIVIDVFAGDPPPSSAYSAPERVEQEVKEEEQEKQVAQAVGAEVPAPPAMDERGARPIRIIMIDPGHGGRDPGAISPTGLEEKDVAFRLAKLIADRIRRDHGIEAFLTREHDTYLDLEERSKRANEIRADLFISIHMNAAQTSETEGIETYYLDSARDEQTRRVAARENGTTVEGLSDLTFMLADLRVSKNAELSSAVGNSIHGELVRAARGHSRGVVDLGIKSGPFYVLFGAEMPAVLIEAGFVSNAREERRLRSRAYLAALAEGISAGLDEVIAGSRAGEVVSRKP